MKTLLKNTIAIAALKVDLQKSATGELRLLPAGYFKARDGRPHELPEGWFIDAALAAQIIEQAQSIQDDAVIDYEHQTLYSQENGKPAPAAGWFSPQSLEWREDGLYATEVQWTAAAKTAIEAGEYRYLSPVITYNKATGAVTGVSMAALVNYAAVDGLDGLTARAAAKFAIQDFSTQEDSTVDKTKLIVLLGLAADSDDAAIETALQALKAKADTQDGEVTALKSQVATLKSQTPDLSQYVPKTVYDEACTQLAALKADGDKGQVEALIKQGLEDGRIAGAATAQWLRDQGIEALKAHLADAPSIAALKTTQTNGKAPEGESNAQLNAEEIAVCKSMGITQTEFLKAKGAL